MDHKLKEKWVKALRSGRYKQAQDTLYDGNGFCCLGVLCSVAGARWKKDPLTGDMEAFFRGEKISNREEEFLATAFRKRIGLHGKTQQRLARMNDGDNIKAGKSFAQIAAFIERHL